MTKRIAINKDWMFQSDFEQDMIKKVMIPPGWSRSNCRIRIKYFHIITLMNRSIR